MKGRPSKTARKVALNIVTLGAKPGMDEVLPAGIVDATATLLVESGAVGATAVRWSRSRKMVSVYMAFDWMMPGQFEAFGHRKSFCERQVRDGIGAGASQVLVLGAGYDTMGWRLAPEFLGVDFFEIDHPATAGFKAKGIGAMGQRSNLHLIAEDLEIQELIPEFPIERYRHAHVTAFQTTKARARSRCRPTRKRFWVIPCTDKNRCARAVSD